MNEVAMISTEQIKNITDLAVIMGKGKLFGKTAEELAPLMLLAHAEGRNPISVMNEYDVIQGRPAIKSQTALIRFQNSGGRIEWLERTSAKVTGKFIHEKGGSVTVTWDMQRAKAMGLAGKQNWINQPMVMMTWRCVAEGVRLVWPTCLSGFYLVEEVQDFDDKPAGKKQAPPVTEPIAQPTSPEPVVQPEKPAAPAAPEAEDAEIIPNDTEGATQPTEQPQQEPERQAPNSEWPTECDPVNPGPLQLEAENRYRKRLSELKSRIDFDDLAKQTPLTNGRLQALMQARLFYRNKDNFNQTYQLEWEVKAGQDPLFIQVNSKYEVDCMPF